MVEAPLRTSVEVVIPVQTEKVSGDDEKVEKEEEPVVGKEVLKMQIQENEMEDEDEERRAKEEGRERQEQQGEEEEPIRGKKEQARELEGEKVQHTKVVLEDQENKHIHQQVK